MALFALDESTGFPPVELAEPDGLLAIGGDLSTQRLLRAYSSGIFPWYQGDQILWWCPDPRFVLFPRELHVSKSMKVLLKRNAFQFTFNKAFREVIRACAASPRRDQDGTWLSPEMQEAYIQLHELGFAHSAEAWEGENLAGGLYGVRLGRVFFGESMFSARPNASKYAFIRYVEDLQREGVELIDCQVHTTHLESLGARLIPRREFQELLRKWLGDSQAGC